MPIFMSLSEKQVVDFLLSSIPATLACPRLLFEFLILSFFRINHWACSVSFCRWFSSHSNVFFRRPSKCPSCLRTCPSQLWFYRQKVSKILPIPFSLCTDFKFNKELAATLRWFTAGGAIRMAVRQLLQTWKKCHYDVIDDVIIRKL